MYLLKVVRARKAQQIMSSKFLSEVVDTFFQKRLKNVIKEYEKDPHANFNPNVD